MAHYLLGMYDEHEVVSLAALKGCEGLLVGANNRDGSNHQRPSCFGVGAN